MADARQYVLDAGNTRLKIGRFEGGELVQVEALALTDWQQHRLTLPAEAAALASVSVPEGDLESWLKKRGVHRIVRFDPQAPLPFESKYTSPETLGSDRKMLVLGAISQYPKRNRLIIGLGSCITYDLLTSQNVHLGGDISPGMHMRWRAMHEFTARLPLVTESEPVQPLGTDTLSALRSGVVQGILAEIQGRCQQLEQQIPDLTIILTGGDAHFFEKQINSPIFAEPNLALYGLHALL
ncbi:MAG: type III pantothenate kinase [Sphingobacteriaceae bacterium]|nr:type III pantothenate kinase [Sphingobacteriaceae bacterium]